MQHNLWKINLKITIIDVKLIDINKYEIIIIISVIVILIVLYFIFRESDKFVECSSSLK